MKTFRIMMILAVMMLAALACQTTGLTPVAPAPIPVLQIAPPAGSAPVEISANPAAQQDSLTTLYNQVSPSIVAILVTTDQGGSLGSGFVYDNLGHIVTNYHVVEGANRWEVGFWAGFRVYGWVIGTALDSDLAVIKVNAPPRNCIPLRWAIRPFCKLDRPWSPSAIPLGWTAR